MSQGKLAFIINLAHDTFHKGRLTFTVLSHKSNLLATIDGQIDIMEDNMRSVSFLHIFADHRIVATTAGADKLKPQR